jgi:hypothetical protein
MTADYEPDVETDAAKRAGSPFAAWSVSQHVVSPAGQIWKPQTPSWNIRGWPSHSKRSRIMDRARAKAQTVSNRGDASAG